MKSDVATQEMPGFWATVGILLRSARKRAAGRQKRQAELLRQRTGKKAVVRWGSFGFVLAIFLMAGLHIAAAFVAYTAVTASELIAAERGGKMVVDDWFSKTVVSTAEWDARGDHKWDANLERDYGIEARILSREHGGDVVAMEQKLRRAVQAHGTGDFLSESQAVAGFNALPKAGPLAGLLGSIVLFWWLVMLVFQGEGLDLDLQRRRHPMWEWLFSHPVPIGAVFLAEMLSPIAANPVYISAPLFPGFLYGFIYGPGLGCLAAFLVGVPLMLAAASLGKALEIGVILRFAPRTRGAVVGIMSWIGYASLMLFFISIATMSKAVYSIAAWLQPLAVFPSPWLGMFLGETWSGTFSFPWGIAIGWLISALTIGVSISISVWGAQQGLSGNFGRADSVASPAASGPTRFTKDPLYRKELLWFKRDRSAIVQTILVPLTVAGFQLFNMRGIVSQAQGAWNFLCGGGILFGTYFLWILGPKSLASEGSALWIALTWPRGLESLLKAKARLWSMISSGVVGLVLIYAAVLYPANIVNIGLVCVGWYFFGRSMAEKAVTLVTVTSDSGETQKIPTGRRWAAQLGMLTFAIGILTQQWHIAIMGIVYSWLTAAAMWENFRARLPFLYDPWSEKSPPPPTLMNAMISISILVESGAVLTGIALVSAGRSNIAVLQVMIYGLCAFIVSLSVWKFLSNRGVTLNDVWQWPRPDGDPMTKKPWWCGSGGYGASFFIAIESGAVAGLALGAFGHAYLTLLGHIPYTAELLRKSQEQMDSLPGLHQSYTIMAIAFAPWAEEYLFRGLLFRALDREWGGWQAIVGSAAFFAIYHPVLSWLPVGLLGIANATIFKRTGRLAPAVILHMVYNTVVLS